MSELLKRRDNLVVNDPLLQFGLLSRWWIMMKMMVVIFVMMNDDGDVSGVVDDGDGGDGVKL